MPSFYLIEEMTPELLTWKNSTIQVGVTNVIRLTWIAANNDVKSQLLIRRRWGDYSEKAVWVYPDVLLPVVVSLPQILEQESPPTLEIMKYISRRRLSRYGIISEDNYSVKIEAYL